MRIGFLWAACAALVLGGCARSEISVQTESFTVRDLASYKVRTPDSRRWCPSIGQRVIVRWFFDDLDPQPTLLTMRVRYFSRDEDEITIPLDRSTGMYIHEIADQDYLCMGGVLSYYVEAWADEELICTKKHQLWTEFIDVSPEES